MKEEISIEKDYRKLASIGALISEEDQVVTLFGRLHLQTQGSTEFITQRS